MNQQQFKDVRKNLGLTQQEMANWLYLKSHRTIQEWESGRNIIPGTVKKCFELAGLL